VLETETETHRGREGERESIEKKIIPERAELSRESGAIDKWAGQRDVAVWDEEEEEEEEEDEQWTTIFVEEVNKQLGTR
jgi:hypothetical protein